MGDLAEFVERLLDETRDEIERADAKANILLGAVGIATASLIGALFAANVRVEQVKAPVWMLGGVCAIGMTVGVGYLGAAVLPRLGRPAAGRARYFMDHAQYEVADLRRVVEEEASQPVHRNLEQLQHLSMIVKTKYQLCIVGELAAGIGLLAAALSTLLYLFTEP